MAADNGTLAGKTIIVTGAGSGIGKATATLAARQGATVIVTDVTGHDDTASEIGGSAEAHVLDVTDSGAWSSVVDGVLSSHGTVDGLANVAGIVTDADALGTQTEEGWASIIDVDLKGVFLGMKTVLQPMLDAGGGKIVNVASVAGLIGMPNVLTYSAAKGGVIAMGRQVAIEYAAQGLRVNTIAPGVTETAMLGDITEELLGQVKAATPTQRLGAPEDVGGMIVYLLGPGSDFVTGQTFPVDGGWTAQ